MRIALIASSFDPYVGGVESHVKNVARELAAHGLAVEVWTVDRGERLGIRDVDGIRVRYLPTPLPARNAAAMARFAAAAPGACAQWRRAYREFSPQLLHVHCFGPNGVYALALHRRLGAPLGVTSHGETLGDDNAVFARSALLRRSLTAALSNAAFVTAPSEYVLDDLRAGYGLVDGVVVPNGVSDEVQPSGETFWHTPYVLGVGRLGRMKGFDLLIDAFAESGIGDGHLLLIAGVGPERDSLLKQAERLGVSGRLRLLGRLTEQQVADAMAGARAVAVPSRSEAFGIVALEAWRAGAALIMTNRGGGPGFVRDGVDGLLVDPENTGQLAAALRTVVGNDDLRVRLASAGAARVSEFTWSAVGAAYRTLYDRAVDPAHRSD